MPTLADPVAIDRGAPAVETLETPYPIGRADCKGERYRGERRSWCGMRRERAGEASEFLWIYMEKIT